MPYVDDKGVLYSVEIQVTDIISHVINEIGHDLIYKNMATIERLKASRTEQSKNVARLLEAFRALYFNLEASQQAVERIAKLSETLGGTRS